ncbi:protein LURP-one-related 8 [Lolium perenne]|uniref:protein LURP-one-related 8 n=1 Tax=Lolium perenne TaxID=4522 RepID=UPI0021EA8B1C|nr:protein LURP-one-related 8-like [Lolium perenne]
MAKVHPDDAARPGVTGVEEEEHPKPAESTALTVWRKSLLFNCDGFTVFDARGGLAFRVDCYGTSGSRRRHAEAVVLMDAAGVPLITVRRRRLSLAEHWVVYDGDGGEGDHAPRPLLSVRRCHARLLRHAHSSSPSKQKALAHITSLSPALPGAYVVEGSYAQRSVAVRDAQGEAVAEMRRKESPVGDEVFRLVVSDPRRLGAPLAMGIVIALDEMFGGRTGGASAARSLLRRSWSM